MRLTRHAIRELTAGHKTQHRVRDTGRTPRTGTRKIHGRDLHVAVTSVRRQTLGDITFEEARAEGHKTRAAFADDWMLRHDPHWPPTDPCQHCDGDGTIDCPDCWEQRPTGPYRLHPLDAHPCPHCDHGQVPTDLDDNLILATFDERHGMTVVWVLEVQVADVSTFLDWCGRGDEHGHTHRRDEIDAGDRVDPDSLHHRWRDEAQQRHQSARPNQKHPDDQLRARRARKAALTRDAETLRRLADELEDIA